MLQLPQNSSGPPRALDLQAPESAQGCSRPGDIIGPEPGKAFALHSRPFEVGDKTRIAAKSHHRRYPLGMPSGQRQRQLPSQGPAEVHGMLGRRREHGLKHPCQNHLAVNTNTRSAAWQVQQSDVCPGSQRGQQRPQISQLLPQPCSSTSSCCAPSVAGRYSGLRYTSGLVPAAGQLFQ